MRKHEYAMQSLRILQVWQSCGIQSWLVDSLKLSKNDMSYIGIYIAVVSTPFVRRQHMVVQFWWVVQLNTPLVAKVQANHQHLTMEGTLPWVFLPRLIEMSSI